MRYAIYFVPNADSSLARKAASWLQYDIADGRPIIPTGNTPGALQRWIAEPRRYGFHATIKAPFRLADGFGESELIEAFDRFCDKEPNIGTTALALRQVEGFLALVPRDDSHLISDLAARCVTDLDPFRAPMTEAERAKRLLSPLPARQMELLNQWGYPHVFECFRFHMTLTAQLPPEDLESAGALLNSLLSAVDLVLDFDELALCIQPSIAENFTVFRRVPLRNKT